MKSKNLVAIAAWLCLAITVQAANFTVNVWFNDTVSDPETYGPTLVFGQTDVETQQIQVPYPPMEFLPSHAWLVGTGHADNGDSLNYQVLSTDIRAPQPYAVWKIQTTGSFLFTFKIAETLPAGASLVIYKEGTQDSEIAIEDGVSMTAEANAVYRVEYLENGAVITADAPDAVAEQMLCTSGNVCSVSWTAAPDGYSIAAGKATAYKQVKTTLADGSVSYSYEKISEDFGSVNVSDGTYTLPTDVTTDDPVRVTFDYWFAKDALTSSSAVVTIDLVKGVCSKLVAMETVTSEGTIRHESTRIAVDPTADGYKGTDLSYELRFDAAAKGKELTYNVSLVPDLFKSYGVQVAFTETIPAADDAFSTVSDNAFTYTAQADVLYMTLRVSLTSKSDYSSVTPSVTVADGSVNSFEKVFFRVASNGTLDFDNDGMLTNNDVMYLYNFIGYGDVSAQSFPDHSEEYSWFTPDMLLDFTDGTVDEEDAATAWECFLQNIDALDYDGDGRLTNNDVMYLYNFVGYGDIEAQSFPDHSEEYSWFTADMLLDFTDGTVDEEDAAAAWETMIQYVNALK